MKWGAGALALLLATSAFAQARQGGTGTGLPDDAPRRVVVLTPEEAINAARRIERCEASEASLKKSLDEAPSPSLMIALGFVGGIIVAGAAFKVLGK